MRKPMSGPLGGLRKPFPLNLFGVAFGLSGLAGTWTVTAGATAAITTAWWLVAAAVWLGSALRYGLAAGTARRMLDDHAHPVLGPFAALVPVTGMLLGSQLSRFAPQAGRVVVLVMVAAAATIGALYLTRALTGRHDLDSQHAGHLLPTVAAGLIGGQSLATVGLHDAALAAFAVGMLMWVLLGATILARLASRPPLPDALVPTHAIFAAPPAVAGNAWFTLNGGAPDLFEHALLGVFALFFLSQLTLLPRYTRLPFTHGFWALTFTIAAGGTYGIHWLTATHAAGATTWTVLAVTTALIASIAVRSIALAIRGTQPAVRRVRAARLPAVSLRWQHTRGGSADGGLGPVVPRVRTGDGRAGHAGGNGVGRRK
ncbi:hypothetical protein [Amycolatopsis sp. NPDC001319]|uniref:SLAC1 family transporter n=2 Tax=unclassified Amycolatopsis TaxID=2618356 RepID=UPI0036B5E2BD